MAIKNQIYKLSMVAVCATMLNLLLHANIDTTTGPDLDKAIILSSTYTFTNFELARGYARFRKGFTVPAGVTAFIDVHEPVSGVLTINGTLNLLNDLYLSQGVSIVTDGAGVGSMTNTINLNGYTIILNDDLEINSWLNIFAEPGGVIDGQSHRIRLPDGSDRLELSKNYYGIDDNATSITIRNVTLENLKGNNLQAPGYLLTNSPHSASITLNDVELQVAAGNPFTLTSENIHINKDVDILATGDSTITFSNGNVGQWYIHSGAIFYVNPGIPFQYAGSNNPIFDDSSSVMHFNSATFSWYSTIPTMTLTVGNIIVEGNVTFARTGLLGSGGAITFGNGNAADDLYLYILPGSTLEVGENTTLNYANAV